MSSVGSPPGLRLAACGGLLDQRSDGIGLRDVHGVAALDLDHRGARPFGHGTLGVRWDPLVFGGDEIPARLGSPRWFANFAAKTRYAPPHLGFRHQPALLSFAVCSRSG